MATVRIEPVKPLKKEKLLHKPGLLLVLLVILVLISGIFLGMRAIGAILIIADPLKKADAAVALTGDKGDRITEAATLYQNDYVDYLFITYTDDQTREELKKWATDAGIPSRKIYVTSAMVANTVEEARAIRTLAGERKADSLIIITDPYHTLRTRLIFHRELKGSGIDIQVRPVRDHWYRSSTWWKTGEGLQYTTEEYLKIIFYLFGVY